MKTAFTPGTRVRFNIPDGSEATIDWKLKSYGWKIPGYLGNGFYEVDLPNGKPLVAHEDDLVLVGAELAAQS